MTLALDANGSAITENTAYMESLEAKTNNLKATFQDLATNVIDDELVGAVLDLANGLLQLANTDLGRFITQVTLLTGLGWGATGLLQASKIIPAVTSQFKTFGDIVTKGLGATAAAMSKGGAAVSGLTAALSGALPVILAVSAALAIGGALWKATEDSRKSFAELDEKVQETTGQLESNKARLEEINAMGWTDITSDIVAERNQLEEENAELEKQIQHWKDLRQEKLRGSTEGSITVSGWQTETTIDYGEGAFLAASQAAIEYGDSVAAAEAELAAFGDTSNAVVETETYRTQITLEGADAEAYMVEKGNELINTLNTKNSLTQQEAELYVELVPQMQNYIAYLQENGENTERLSQLLIKLQNAYDSAKAKIDTFVSGLISEATKSEDAAAALNNLIIQQNALSNSGLDISQQLTALKALAEQAGYTASAIAAVMGMSDLSVQNQIRASATGLVQQAHYAGKKLSSEEAMRQATSNYMKGLWGSLTTFYTSTNPLKGNTSGTGTGGYTGTSTSTQTQKNKEEAEDAVKEVEETAETAVDNVSDSVSDALNEQKQMMQGVIDYYVEYASRKIEELQDQIDAINDKYDQMLQDAEDRAQAQLDALEAQNDAVEDQITLQEKLNALDKAKNTMQMVFKDGQFVYQADADEVSKSQNELNAYYRQKDYENRKKYIEDSLKAEKEYIETLRKNETAALEEEKALWEEYKEGWSNLTSEYEYQQNKLLADQMFGAEQENATWETRLANLQSFVSQYNSLMASINSGSSSGSSSGGSGTTSGIWAGSGEGYASDADAWADITNAYNPLWDKDTDYATLLEEGIKAGYGYDWIKGVMGQRNAKMQALGIQGESTADLWNRLKSKYGYGNGNGAYSGDANRTITAANSTKPSRVSNSEQSQVMSMEDEIARNSQAWFDADEEERKRLHERNQQLRKELANMGYASGTTSARGGLAMVGEQGPELRVLNQGDGIIPADITRNLMKIGSDPRLFTSKSGVGNTILNVANVSLPSVRNAQQFVDGLKQMAIQRSYAAT